MGIGLEATPENPPLSVEERVAYKDNYSTELAYLHIYVGDEDIAAGIGSAYMLWLLDSLLAGVEKLLHGEPAKAEWYADPFSLEMKPVLEKNQLLLTLHLSSKRVLFEDIEVPLDEFIQEVLSVAMSWRSYIEQHYADELYLPESSSQFQRFERWRRKAEAAWNTSSAKN